MSVAIHIGTAGWSIPRDAGDRFPGAGTHLERYGRVLNCAEINSSFYRPHRVETYRKWASQTPPDFRFSAKLPRSITHEGRLRDAHIALKNFLAEVTGLGDRLAVLLVQLPPSFVFDAHVVRDFFSLLAEMFDGHVVCEPRHATWSTSSADGLLVDLEVARAAADPARWPQAAVPGGWLGPEGDGRGGILYHRWHGSPRTYWSNYEPEWLEARTRELEAWPVDCEHWCIFDNTAAGHAIRNALELREGFRT